jgi:hypothetical protein
MNEMMTGRPEDLLFLLGQIIDHAVLQRGQRPGLTQELLRTHRQGTARGLPTLSPPP